MKRNAEGRKADGKEKRRFRRRDPARALLSAVIVFFFLAFLLLALKDGSTLTLQSTMEGVYPFMDTAFAGWCMQTGHKIDECSFYDPSKSWWFPQQQEDGEEP